MQIECPHCGQVVVYADPDADQLLQCTSCQEQFCPNEVQRVAAARVVMELDRKEREAAAAIRAHDTRTAEFTRLRKRSGDLGTLGGISYVIGGICFFGWFAQVLEGKFDATMLVVGAATFSFGSMMFLFMHLMRIRAALEKNFLATRGEFEP